jgi:hypothetical protein
MPKLDPDQRKAVDNVDSSGFALLEPGRYIGQLVSVTTRPAVSADKFASWSWEFDLTSPESAKGRKQWANTSLSPAAAWKVREAFDALGFTTDSDTEEMIGESCALFVIQEEAEYGKKKGQQVNRVEKLAPLDEGEDAGDTSDEF